MAATHEEKDEEIKKWKTWFREKQAEANANGAEARRLKDILDKEHAGCAATHDLVAVLVRDLSEERTRCSVLMERLARATDELVRLRLEVQGIAEDQFVSKRKGKSKALTD